MMLSAKVDVLDGVLIIRIHVESTLKKSNVAFKDERLTRRESEVLDHIIQGETNKQIAIALDVTVRTVKFHVSSLFQKCEVRSRIDLFVRNGNGGH
jgi:DNA-binding NarL/FixJ family response regulator